MLKPGTRCGCLERNESVHPAHGGLVQMGGVWSCERPAVRMVEVQVRHSWENPDGDITGENFHAEQVPMCEPCAAYAERA